MTCFGCLVGPSFGWSVGPSVHHSVSMSVHWSIGPSLRLTVRLSIHASVRPSVCPSVHQSQSPFKGIFRVFHIGTLEKTPEGRDSKPKGHFLNFEKYPCVCLSDCLSVCLTFSENADARDVSLMTLYDCKYNLRGQAPCTFDLKVPKYKFRAAPNREKKSKSVFDFLTYSREIWFSFFMGKLRLSINQMSPQTKLIGSVILIIFFHAEWSTTNIFRVMIF